MTALARAARRAFPLAVGVLCLAGPSLSGLEPATAEPADDIRRLLIQIIGAWLLFAVALRAPWSLRPGQRRALWPFAAFAAWIVLTSLLSSWPVGSLAATWPALVAIGLGALAIVHPLRPREVEMWGVALGIGAVIACLWVLGSGAPVDERAASAPRFAYASTFGNPESFAGFLAAVLCSVLAWTFAGPRPRVVQLGLLAASVLWLALLLGTASRGPALALLAGLAVALAALRQRWSASRTAWMAAGGIVLAIVAAHFALGAHSPAAGLAHRIGETFDTAAVSTQHRLAIWRVSANLAQQRPVTGLGWGMYEFAFQPRLAELLASDPSPVWTGAAQALDGRVPYHAHCDYLEVLISTGVPGLLLLLWTLVESLAAGWRGARHESAWRPVKAAALATLVCLAVLSVVSFPLHRPLHAALFWLAAGLSRRPLS